MHTIPDHESEGRRRRRRHGADFKAKVVAACKMAGVSTAAVAMANGVNANLVRRWIIASEQSSNRAEIATPAEPSFVALRVTPPVEQTTPAADIRIELRRGSTSISVAWPTAAAAACAAWLRELVR